MVLSQKEGGEVFVQFAEYHPETVDWLNTIKVFQILRQNCPRFNIFARGSSFLNLEKFNMHLNQTHTVNTT